MATSGAIPEISLGVFQCSSRETFPGALILEDFGSSCLCDTNKCGDSECVCVCCKGKWWLYRKWQDDKVKERGTLWLHVLILKEYCQVRSDTCKCGF